MNPTTAGTAAQVLAGLLIAVLLEGRWLAQAATARPDQSQDRPTLPLDPASPLRTPFILLSLLNVLIGIAGATLGLTLALGSVVTDKPAGHLTTGLLVGGTAAAIFSVMLPPFVYALLAFVESARRLTVSRGVRRTFSAVAVAIMLIAFGGLIYLVVLGLVIESRAART